MSEKTEDSAVEEIVEEDQEVEIIDEPTELESMEEKLKESEANYLRVIAEYDNYRKRTAKEKDAIYPSAQADTIVKVLPVLDNFERALEFDPGSEEFAKGIAMIYDNFKEVFTAMGVEPIGTVGEEFNPLEHNAVMHIEDDSLGKNTIAQVMQKGYKIGDRIIRHASVQIAN